MIKLTPPIQSHNIILKTSGFDAFAKGIIANYEQIGTTLGPNDLVHLVTEPPELFFAEGDSTNIFNQNIDIRTINEKKIETINNLINRITLSESQKLTYQDNVYISSTLRKLGIKNEAEFLSNVYKNLEETKNVSKTVNQINNLTDLIKKSYNTETKSLNQKDENFILTSLRKIGITDTDTFINKVTNRMEEQLTVRKAAPAISNVDMVLTQNTFVNEEGDSEETNTEIINNLLSKSEFAPKLYQQILQRVGINENIDVLKQNTRSTIVNENLTVSEMAFTSFNRQINENNLTEAKESGAIPITLNYREENTYESHPNLTEINEETMSNQLTQAVLYSIIENVNNARVNRGDTWSQKWINIDNAFYNSADNSITRFEENITTPIDRQFYQQQLDQQIIDEITQMEINNQERVKLYQQAQRAQMESDRKMEEIKRQESKRDSKKDSLLALTNPEEFKAQVEREREAAKDIVEKQIERRADELPPTIKARIDLLQAIVKQSNGDDLNQEDAEAIAKVLNQIRSERNVENTIVQQNVFNPVERRVPEEAVPQEAERKAETEEGFFTDGLHINTTENIINNNETQEFYTDGLHINTIENVINGDQGQGGNGRKESRGFERMELLHEGERPQAQEPEPQVTNQPEPGFFTDGLHINKSFNVLNPEGQLIDSYDEYEVEPSPKMYKDGEAFEILQRQLQTIQNGGIPEESTEFIDLPAEEAGMVKQVIRRHHNAARQAQPRRRSDGPSAHQQSVMNHKQIETMDAVEIAEILKETKALLEETKTINEEYHSVENIHKTEEKTRNIVKNEIENFNFEQQIHNTVHRELNDFEGTMFNKLESKLESEQQRRGIF